MFFIVAVVEYKGNSICSFNVGMILGKLFSSSICAFVIRSWSYCENLIGVHIGKNLKSGLWSHLGAFETWLSSLLAVLILGNLCHAYSVCLPHSLHFFYLPFSDRLCIGNIHSYVSHSNKLFI